MAFLWTTLLAVVMMTVAMSKPVCLSEEEDSSKSSESSETSSSEQTDTHDPIQPVFTETDMPKARETEPLDTTVLPPHADSRPSPAMLNTSALPDLDDTQASSDIDAVQLLPGDPPQTAVGMDISQDAPDPAQDSINTNNMHIPANTAVSLHPGKTESDLIIGVGGTTEPQVTTTTSTTYQGFPQGATPPFPPHITKPTLSKPAFSTSPSLPVTTGTALTGGPGCLSSQCRASEPDPPRGDSI